MIWAIRSESRQEEHAEEEMRSDSSNQREFVIIDLAKHKI
jgi:hypothetical protein